MNRPAKWYIIRSMTEKEGDTPLYWSNAHGWIDRALASKFSEEDTKRLRLPLAGVWEVCDR